MICSDPDNPPEDGPPERCVAAHASELTSALRPLRNTLERLSLEIVEQYGCDHHKQEALDLSGFTNLRILNLVPELLLTSVSHSRDTDPVPMEPEEFVFMIDRLPKSLEQATFYAAPRRNRGIKFWCKLILHIVENRDLLPNIQTIKIMVYNRLIQRCPLCSENRLTTVMSDDECQEIDKMSIACEGACLRLRGDWRLNRSFRTWAVDQKVPSKTMFR